MLFDQGFDVTDDVLQKLDETLPTMAVNFVAPVVAARAVRRQPLLRAKPAKKKQ